MALGHAVRQSEKLPQETLLQLPEQRHVGAALAATQHRAQGDHQDLPEQVALGIAPAWILKRCKSSRQPLHDTAPPSLRCPQQPRSPQPANPRPKCDRPANGLDFEPTTGAMW